MRTDETPEQVLTRLLGNAPDTQEDTSMTQRDLTRTEATDAPVAVGVYDTNTTRTVSTPAVGVKPTDLIHWGSIIAGLFAAMATLITLAVLGIAIGLSSFDASAPLGNFGIGAGIWSAVTALLAFGIGGWLAGRSTAVRGTTSGILNGAMVWFVTIPLLIYLLGSGIGALVSTAGSVAGTAVQAGAAAAGAASNNPSLQQTASAAASNPSLQTTAQGAVQAVQGTAQAVAGQVTPERVENAVNSAGPAAWGTLLSLGLAAAAAIGGGVLGARAQDTDTMTISSTQRRTA